MYNVLKADPRVSSITTFMGCSSPRFQICYAPQLGGRNFAQFIVNTPSNKATVQLLDEYAPKWSNHFPGAYIRFKQLDFLSVTSYDLRLYGDNIDSLRKASEMVMAKMRQTDGVEWVRTTFDEPHPILDIELDPVVSSQLGINRTLAQLQLYMQTGDIAAGSIWEGDYEVPVVIKDRATDNMQLGDVKDTYLSTLTGRSVPLRQVAQVEPKWSESKITHRNGERCMSVTAEPQRNTVAGNIQKELDKYITQELTLPQGVRYELGGEITKNNQMNREAGLSIGIAMIIIFFFLLFNFKRFDTSLLCIVAIMLAVPGAVIGLLVANRILSITALLGFITLMGIIMRNEILIFEHADQKVAEGMSVRDAAYDAGRRRMVPIFLTTATTAVGVIPMIIAGSSFWMPVGVTIFAGGIGVLILVVTVLPVAYYKLLSREKKE